MIAALLIHFAVTWALIGLIWTIQGVHYPLLKNVGQEGFVAYHARHVSLITWLVGPLMFVETASAAWLIFLGERSMLFLISLGALVLVWASTAFGQVPLHHKLTRGHDPAIIDRLVRSNRWRTMYWTIRGLCLVALLVMRFS
jgi:hypothetical protein